MNKLKTNRRRSRFFLIIGLVGLFAIVAGFSKTFIIPVSSKTFKAPASIYVHAFFSFVWVLLFTVQAFLIQRKKHRLHIKLGVAGVVIALATGITLIPVAKFIVERGLQLGLGDESYSAGVGVFTTSIMFLLLAGFGLYYRKKVQLHKRLLLLATIVLLWPAWFRFRHFFPQIPRPEIWFGLVLADSLIVVSWVWDKIQNKSIHPALLYVGLAIIAEQSLEVFMYDSATWRVIGKALYTTF